ncbi:structural protein [Cellulophaga phage phi4:1]|uniref:Structural protein n=5 Tax=Lightbulbvirus TaxID=1918522 RepID=A0A0S2MWG6_9CAUD|nr:structural protein [Cellulophaga phage phi4:1]YP_008241550.1 structural protein [Cellulophaga phage phi17:2]ALO80062.1 structural protein [Cellulophaga phage phi4:1_13]ALO80259.1 structural protein [Cellulophaga phage phi4:1_18]ALO80458.1 structural protein [Cellulophaga phage phi17:2_18]AGO47588.1 structural protein [Cellulophaga phage phi17:2]AGO49466.1 structural protein [Cellulophaga phage phi4:1]
MSNTDNCKQTNIPETDNTALECPIFLQDTCVIVKDGQPFILSDSNISLTEYNEKLIEKLVEFNQKITLLENSNPELMDFSFSIQETTLALLVSDNIVASIDLQSLITGGVTEAKEVFIAVGGETTLTLSNNALSTTVNQVSIEGIVQLEGSSNDYSLTNNIVYFSDPLESGEIVQVIYKY